GIGLTDIAHHGIIAFPALGVGYVDNFMAGAIEHGADQMIESGIHTGKDRGSRLLYHIDLGQEITGLADQEFSGFKGQGKVPSIFLAEFVEPGGEFPAQLLDIGLYVPLFVGDLKATAEVDELQVAEILGGFEQDLRGIEEHFNIQDIASRVHMDPIDVHVCQFHDSQQMGNLVYADTKLGVDMAHGNLGVSPGHHVGVDSDTYRDVRMLSPKLFQNGKVVNVHLYPKGRCLFDLLQGNPVGGEYDGSRVKTCQEPQFHLLDGHSVQATAQMIHEPEDIDVGEGLG